MDFKNGGGHKIRNICIGLLVTIILIVVIIVILAFTVFKAKRPVINVQSVAIDDVDFSFNLPRFSFNLNLSLDTQVSVKNPNKVGFKFSPSSAALNYRGDLVGEVPIPAGKISAGETVVMNLTLTLMADRFFSNSQAISDARSGKLPLNTFTKISGKVSVLKIFNVHVVSSSSCDFIVDIRNRTLGDQQCQYKTKL